MQGFSIFVVAFKLFREAMATRMVLLLLPWKKRNQKHQRRRKKPKKVMMVMRRRNLIQESYPDNMIKAKILMHHYIQYQIYGCHKSKTKNQRLVDLGEYFSK